MSELCAKCGEPLYARTHPGLRLCARHTREHLASLPPSACTDADLREGPTADEPCPHCGHPKRLHDFQPDGCSTCGCTEWDPMCTAVESEREHPAATVTPIGGNS